uniref:Uncharacterized protein n=1 Tax=Solanum lycopersicum TaxID=4081 RepID=A0A3Q7GNZ1_SOLLC
MGFVACIPGALFFDIDGITDRTTNLPHMLSSKEAFAIKNKDEVVVYDGKASFSCRRKVKRSIQDRTYQHIDARCKSRALLDAFLINNYFNMLVKRGYCLVV